MDLPFDLVLENATLVDGTGKPAYLADVAVRGSVTWNAPAVRVWLYGAPVEPLGSVGGSTAIAGQATYQDVDSNSTAFFYTAPITKLDYLMGRCVGALVVQVVIFSSVGLGVWVGVHTPWLDATRLGPERIAAYLQPYALLVLPNLFLTKTHFSLRLTAAPSRWLSKSDRI